MNMKQANRLLGSKELNTELYRLNYFRPKKQFEQFKMLYGRNAKSRDLHGVKKDAVQARSSDEFSRFQKSVLPLDMINEYSTNYLHTPGITYGITPGLGKPISEFCDCSQTVTNRIASNSVITALVSIQYLTLMCTNYCIKKLKRRNHRAKVPSTNTQWKPSYIPYSENETILQKKSNDAINHKNRFFNSKTKPPSIKYDRYKNLSHISEITNKNAQWKPSYIPYSENNNLIQDKSNDAVKHENKIFDPKTKFTSFKYDKYKHLIRLPMNLDSPHILNATAIPLYPSNSIPNLDTTSVNLTFATLKEGSASKILRNHTYDLFDYDKFTRLTNNSSSTLFNK